jgi:3-dehydroquinate synthase
VEVCRVKERIVAADPLEKGIRKALNLGHTIGHAVESLMMRRDTPITHGHAVMVGLVAEAVISVMRKEMASPLLYDLAAILNRNYPRILITCDDYPALLALMRHDKKNDGTGINFTLLRSPGDFLINSIATDEELTSALDIYRDLTGI